MKSFKTNFSGSIIPLCNKTGGMIKSIGAKIFCCVAVLLLCGNTLFSQAPLMEKRIFNIRYVSTIGVGGAIVFDLQLRAGPGYQSTGWLMISANVLMEPTAVDPGLILNIAGTTVSTPSPNPHGISSAGITPIPFLPTLLNVVVNKNAPTVANDFKTAWATVAVCTIPVLGGTPTTASYVIPTISDGSPWTSSWSSGLNPGVRQAFAPACPLISRVGVDPFPAFLFDTLYYCIQETPIALPSTSNNGITGTWSPATISTAVPGTIDYTFTPDDVDFCASIATVIVLPHTGINVEDIVDACTGVVDLTEAVVPGTTNLADYKFYTCSVCDGSDYTEVGPTVVISTINDTTFYVRYASTDTCPSDYIPFLVSLIQAPNAATTDVTCNAGVITEISITAPIGNYSYSIDGMAYQTGTLFTSLNDIEYTVYVMDNVTGCVTSTAVSCSPCPDMPELIITNPGSGSICIGSGTYTVSGTFVHADSVMVAHNGAGAFTTANKFYTPPFTVRYAPVAGDIGNTVTLTFTIAQTATCPEIVETVNFVVNGLPSAPGIDSTYQQFCDGAIVNDLNANGFDVVWYSSPTGGSALSGNLPLRHDSIYYAAQVLPTGCESAVRSGVKVGLVSAEELPAPSVPNQILCIGATVADIITDGSSGIAIYTTLTGGTPLAEYEPLTNGITYYAGYSFGANACESELRTPFTVTLNTNQADEPIIEDQIFCEGATIANIVVPNTGIVWYSGPTTPSRLNPGTILQSGTYYAAQTKGSSCAESDRVPVEITIGGTIPPPITHGPYNLCNGATLGSVNVTGFGVTWYDVPTGGIALPLSMEIPVGTHTYYAEQRSSANCYSAVRAMVEVTVANCGDLLDCDAMVDRTAEEDYYRACRYTHVGTAWDAITLVAEPLDSAQYYINGILYSSGETASLNGAIFPIGVSQVMVIGFSGSTPDTCEFTVTVELACPPNAIDDEGHIYTVTKVAGLCWTSNLRATKYSDLAANDIAFARPYYSPLYPDVAAHDTIFGLLYTWYSAVGIPEGSSSLPTPGTGGLIQGICPVGWHIPSQAEWDLLGAYSAQDLKSTQYWLVPGTNLTGFDSRPAGRYKGSIDQFVDLLGFTGYWSCDVASSQNAQSFTFTYYCSQIEEIVTDKADGLSVRCVWNGETCPAP